MNFTPKSKTVKNYCSHCNHHIDHHDKGVTCSVQPPPTPPQQYAGPGSDSTFHSKAAEAAYAEGANAVLRSMQQPQGTGSYVVRDGRQDIAEIDFLALNIQRCLSRGEDLQHLLPPKHRIVSGSLNRCAINLCVEIKASWHRVVEYDHDDGWTKKTAKYKRALKFLGTSSDVTLFVILFNGADPQSVQELPLCRHLTELGYLMVWYQTAALYRWAPMMDASRERAPATITTTFWAQLMLPAEDPTQHSKAVAFQVTPAIANIDGLKDAFKTKVEANTGERVNVFTMKVFAYDDATRAWVEVPEDAPLVPNVKATAYHVLVP